MCSPCKTQSTTFVPLFHLVLILTTEVTIMEEQLFLQCFCATLTTLRFHRRPSEIFTEGALFKTLGKTLE